VLNRYGLYGIDELHETEQEQDSTLPSHLHGLLQDAGESKPVSMAVFHGSPHHDLTHVSATPPARQYDNGTSQLGAFFATKHEHAKDYAGKSGRVYSANLSLMKPFEAPSSVFNYLQDLAKDRDRKPVPPHKWDDRLDELRKEGHALRQELTRRGHDGVIFRHRSGDVHEISSFADTPIQPHRA
jgi:hypothetical protein